MSILSPLNSLLGALLTQLLQMEVKIGALVYRSRGLIKLSVRGILRSSKLAFKVILLVAVARMPG